MLSHSEQDITIRVHVFRVSGFQPQIWFVAMPGRICVPFKGSPFLLPLRGPGLSASGKPAR